MSGPLISIIVQSLYNQCATLEYYSASCREEVKREIADALVHFKEAERILDGVQKMIDGRAKP